MESIPSSRVEVASSPMTDTNFALFVCLHPVKIPIKNRHVFITSGSSGIGLALAHRDVAKGERLHSRMVAGEAGGGAQRDPPRHRDRGGIHGGRAGL